MGSPHWCFDYIVVLILYDWLAIATTVMLIKFLELYPRIKIARRLSGRPPGRWGQKVVKWRPGTERRKTVVKVAGMQMDADGASKTGLFGDPWGRLMTRSGWRSADIMIKWSHSSIPLGEVATLTWVPTFIYNKWVTVRYLIFNTNFFAHCTFSWLYIHT